MRVSRFKAEKMLRLLAIALPALGACAVERDDPPMWATLDGNPPLVIAHRGASGFRPEHTLEAYALSVDMGADIVEPDLVFSKDGVLVARHDRYLSTTTDVADHLEFADRKRANDDSADAPRDDWWIEDFTLAELRTLRTRQPSPGRSKEFDGLYCIPTFEEMLALVARKAKEAGRPVGVYPETKHPGFYAAKGYDFEKPLLKALSGFNAGPVFIQSFEPEILKRLKGKSNAKLVQLVYEASPGAGPNIPLEEIAKYADGVGAAKELAASKGGVGSDYARTAHSLGLFVHVWTIRNDIPFDPVESLGDPAPGQLIGLVVEFRNDAGETINPELVTDELRYFYAIGADGVFADFPDRAVAVRGAMTAGRRK